MNSGANNAFKSLDGFEGIILGIRKQWQKLFYIIAFLQLSEFHRSGKQKIKALRPQ